MQNRLAWVALAVGAYVAFLVSQFPAATALRWFAPPQFIASGVTGTIWSGGAQLASLPGLPLRDLRWNISGARLFLLTLSGQFSARLSDGFLQSGFARSFGGTRLDDLQLSTSIETVAGVLPVSGVLGQMSATLDSLRMAEQWPTEVVGTIRLSRLEVEPFAGAGNRMITLGDYELVFSETQDSVVRGVVRDTSGPLELDATLALYPNREYELAGWLVARPDAQRELLQGLSIMLPEPDPDGRREFSFPGSL